MAAFTSSDTCSRTRGSREALNFDIVFLNICDDGQCYTIGEQAERLLAAGLTDIEHRPAPAGSAPPGNILLAARKT